MELPKCDILLPKDGRGVDNCFFSLNNLCIIKYFVFDKRIPDCQWIEGGSSHIVLEVWFPFNKYPKLLPTGLSLQLVLHLRTETSPQYLKWIFFLLVST